MGGPSVIGFRPAAVFFSIPLDRTGRIMARKNRRSPKGGEVGRLPPTGSGHSPPNRLLWMPTKNALAKKSPKSFALSSGQSEPIKSLIHDPAVRIALGWQPAFRND